VALPVLLTVGAIDGVLILAVVALYRTTTKGLHDDLRLAFGEQAVRRESLDDGRQVPIGPVPIGPVPIGPVPIGPVPIGPVPIGPVLNRPVPPRPRRPPLVVHSRAGTYPPLLQFLVTVAFLGFAAACVLAYATHSLLPFTVTSMVVAGLFVIVVLPVVVTAVWTPREFRRGAATSLLYLMLSRQRRPAEGAIPGPADLTVSTPAAERDGELHEPET
jgi:hypothetical protein